MIKSKKNKINSKNMSIKGIELNKIKPQYKFTINQEKEINEAKNWMLTKYKKVRVSQSVEIVKVKPQTIITLTSK